MDGIFNNFSLIYDGNSPICYSAEQLGVKSKDFKNGDILSNNFGQWNRFYFLADWFYPIVKKENSNVRERVQVGAISSEYKTGNSVRNEFNQD